jgi:hypothetical protein
MASPNIIGREADKKPAGGGFSAFWWWSVEREEK